MAYNRKNKLQLIVDIQNVTLDHTKRGVTQQWVYENHIYPKYRISRTTFYAYLATTAKRDLKKMEDQQPQLF